MIAASGDHRVRYLATDTMEEFGLTFGVPFYMYVPAEILDNTGYEYDQNRIGSHRDIYPTLYHFSLSNQEYTSLGGENILSKEGVIDVGYNASRTITKMGAFSNSDPSQLYPWFDDKQLNEASSIENPDLTWAQEYRKLQNYFLRYQVTSAQE